MFSECHKIIFSVVPVQLIAIMITALADGSTRSFYVLRMWNQPIELTEEANMAATSS